MYGSVIFWLYGVGAAVIVIAAFLLLRLVAFCWRMASGFYLAACYRAKFGEWPEMGKQTKRGYEIRR